MSHLSKKEFRAEQGTAKVSQFAHQRVFGRPLSSTDYMIFNATF